MKSVNVAPCVFLALAPFASATIGGKLRVVPHFLSAEEIASYRAIELTEESTFMLDRFEAPALLDSKMVARFRALDDESHDTSTCSVNVGECLVSEGAVADRDLSSYEAQKVKVTMVTSSVREHTDIHAEDLSPVAERVCFTFLNTNPNARFLWGDQEVPVEAGSLMLFHGNVTHSVQVDSGEVRFLGPFTHASFGAIGYGSDKSEAPSAFPSADPSALPSSKPSTSTAPSEYPSAFPSEYPSAFPSEYPSEFPSEFPSEYPSGSPSEAPSKAPSEAPSLSVAPSEAPSQAPSGAPSKTPPEQCFFLIWFITKLIFLASFGTISLSCEIFV